MLERSSRTFFAGLLVACASAAATAQDERSPNIVVILADDLGLRDLALYGGWIETPNIQRLAREGTTFTDFHANSSVCSPTRTAFLTGRYQQRAGIVDVIVGSREPDQGIDPKVKTLPRVFEQSGYATALFGKWHCGYSDRFNPVHHGFDEFVGLLNGGGDYHRHGSWRNGLEKESVEGYSTDVITELSVDFIKRNRERPFLLYVAHQAPHNPYQTRADTPDARAKEWKQNRVGAENRPRYVEMVQDLDAGVGSIIKTLTELGLADDTLVFFWSDNGDVRMSPVEGPHRGRKFSHYEAGHRVPAIAWWPGKVPANRRSAALLAGFDLLPTFTEVAGISDANPPRLDGASFATHLLGDADALLERDMFFGYEPKLGTAMRRGSWKMIVKDDSQQLFDLSVDPKETTDLSERRPDVAQAMRSAIERFKSTVVAESRD